MTKEKALEVAKPYFQQFPKSDKLFVTSDSQVFFTENHALNNARSLDKKNPVVVEVERPIKQAKKEKAADADTDPPAGEGNQEPEKPKNGKSAGKPAAK